jgi:riboflavin synthase
MFTGIIEELGQVADLERGADSARIQICGPLVTRDAEVGSSIAVNGVCLTVTGVDGDTFSADVMAETLARTSLATLTSGTKVNLERALSASGRLGGHIVQGHVDGTGILIDRTPGDRWELVRIAIPAALTRYVAHKGSIAIDGISLTVAGLTDLDDGSAIVTVSLIPETLARTTLGHRAPGDLLNLEADVLAKYVERLNSNLVGA